MYAICGVGNWGSKLLKEFSKNQEFKYFCCNSAEKAASIIKEYPTLKKASLEEICNDVEVSDVIVSVPIEKLHEFSKKLIEHNKNIFLEKPGAKSLIEITRLKKIQYSSFIQLNYKFLFHDKILSLKESVDSGEKIVRFNFEWFKHGSFNNDIRLNLLCHPLSILKFIFPLEDFYMEYLSLNQNSVHINCFSDNIRGKILINRKSKNRKFYLAVENSDKIVKKIDLNSQNLLEKSAKNFINKTSSEIGLEFASEVLKALERIR